MVDYVDDGDGSSNDAMLRSILNMLGLCRFTVTRLETADETSKGEILDGLAIAEISVRRMMADESPDSADTG